MEQALLAFFGNTEAGIGHRKVQLGVRVVQIQQTHAHHDVTIFSELNSIIDEVREYLAYSTGVAQERAREGGGDVAHQFQSFALRALGEKLGHFLHRVAHAEFDNFHAHFSGFYFGEVENVINDGE